MASLYQYNILIFPLHGNELSLNSLKKKTTKIHSYSQVRKLKITCGVQSPIRLIGVARY